MVPLVAATGGYLLLPSGPVRDAAFALIGLACVVTAFVGLHLHAPRRQAGWFLVISGFLGWVVGDALFSLQTAWGVTAYPAPADAVYLVAYLLMAAGLVVMVRRRAGNGDLAAVLDATIVATGAAVVAGVFVLAPVASDSSLSALGKLTSAFYPAADILLLAILVRFWATPSARTTSFRLLVCAFGFIFAGDAYYTTTTIMTGGVESQLANDFVWFAGYILIAGATWDRSVHDLAEPAPGLEDVSDPTKRLLLLTGGLLLPPVTLLGDGLDGEVSQWPIVLIGSVLLSLLVLMRMAGLLTVVRAQAVQLAGLARSDALTGVPNRRSWDHELSRACRTAEDQGTPLTLALLDLDHFKTYNDIHGHPAGDLLLKEATAGWVQHLSGAEVLARVGGEEFAVLLPDHDAESARARVLELLASTPRGQTFSAGVATWQPGTEPAVAVAAADRALYDAKRSGRNRICLAPFVPSGTVLQQPRIALQPMVDLATGEPVAVEALSRFREQRPVEVFEQARTLGRLSELEAAAITAARAVARPGLLLSVNVDIASLPSPRIRESLSGDLTGMVLEVTEHTHTPVDPEALGDVQAALRDYRERGALIAVDDWGTGYSDMDRLELLQPEIVKIDMSIVHDLDSARHQALVGSVLAWANRRHARVCAEGVETEAQLERLRRLGVHLGQGFHLGHPALAEDLGPGTTSSVVARDGSESETIPR
jgi:diguanylate cyclase (GGDEF)-like protein